jgi:hypothetical protein
MVNMEEAETLVNSVLSSLNDLSEDLGDTVKAAVGSPIKFIKVKNNLKKWAKFKLDIAAADMDAIRKKEASGEDVKGIDKEKLTAAVKAKKDAIKGKMDDINNRLNDLAVNNSLKAIVSLGKHKASLEANTKLLKIAQGEENDALRLEIQDKIESDKEAITTAEDQLKTYAKKAKEEPEAKTETKPEAKTETKPEAKKEHKPKKEESESKKEEPTSEEPASKKEEEKEGLTKSQASKKEQAEHLEKQIPELEQELKDKEEAHQITIDNDKEAEANLIAAKKDGDESKIKDAEEKYTELQSNVQTESSEISGIKSKIEDMKSQIGDLKKAYEEENTSIPYSKAVTEAISVEISTKFRDLMNKMK